MDAIHFNDLFQSMLYLEAHEGMESLHHHSYAYMKKEDRDRVFKNYQSISKNIKIESDKPQKELSAEELFTHLKRAFNGGI